MSSETSATATTTDSTTESVYVPQRFSVKFDGRSMPFVSIEKTETIKDGKAVTKRPYDFFVPEVTTVDEYCTWLAWLLNIHETQVKGSGIVHLKKLVEHLVEGANENMLDPETNQLSTTLFGSHLVKPMIRSTTSYASLGREITEFNAQVGQLYTIGKIKDPAEKQAAIVAAGFTEYAQVLSTMDSLVQKVGELMRRQAELLAKKQERENKKKQKELEAATKPATPVGSVPPAAAA